MGDKKSFVDAYLHYSSSQEESNKEYKCEEGIIIFAPALKGEVNIHLIIVERRQRATGILSALITYLKNNVKKITFLLCLSHLLNYILYKNGFGNKKSNMIYTLEKDDTLTYCDVNGMSFYQYMQTLHYTEEETKEYLSITNGETPIR